MSEIMAMISKTAFDLQEHRDKVFSLGKAADRWAMPWLYATRLHALLDCYVALGGDVSKWRNAAGVLERKFPQPHNH